MDERSGTTQQAIDGVTRQVIHLFFRRGAVRGAAIWAMVWGVGVLILRVTTDLPVEQLLWGAIGWAGVLIGVGVWSYRKRPSEQAVRAMLDQQSQMGGLLMAEGEVEVGDWRSNTRSIPRLKFRGKTGGAGGAASWILPGAMVFLTAAFVMPTRFVRPAEAPPMQITSQIDQLQEQITVLEEERIIEDDRADQMREQLERIESQATGDDPIKTWESLDHLQEKLSDAAEKSAEQQIRETEQLAEAQTLADALWQMQDQLDSATMSAGMKTMADLMQQAMMDNEQVSDHLSEALQDAINAGLLDPAMMEQLLSQLGGRKMQISESLGELADLRLIDMKYLSQCEKAGQYDSQSLCEALVFNLNQDTIEGLLSQCRGGQTRGRGDADMVWKQNPSNTEGVDFKEQALPPAQLAALRESKLIGVSRTTPQVDDEAAPSTGGALTNTADDGGSAVSQVVLPRHRAAVRQFFDRQQKTE